MSAHETLPGVQNNFFEEYRPWNVDLVSDVSHLVWINCYGVPLHLWNSETFFSIRRVWGEPISIDDTTSKRVSFSSGKVQISTSSLGLINQVINIEANGKVFPIHVVEEIIVVNNLWKGVCNCDCKGKDIYSSRSSSVDVDLGDLANDTDAMHKDNGRDDLANEMNAMEKEIGRDVVSNILVEVENVSEDGQGKGEEVSNSESGVALGLKVIAEKVISESLSISSPVPIAPKVSKVVNRGDIALKGRRVGPIDSDLISINDSIQKLERRLSRSKRKIKKKKSLSEFGLKEAAMLKTYKKFPSSSLSSQDIRNRNSLLINQARKCMDLGKSLGVKYVGGERSNIKKYIDLEMGDGEMSANELDNMLVGVDDSDVGVSLSECF